ncbi:hypothetical protein [Enterococcus faecalis]|uniref:hypothetical protein n=1 Tax=Enterococcus faecalis TaxID=1351 RepID=UPI0020900C40|nr:hypothetical protein [Enterococcus faecalis]MCO5541006.1 hypothetical protein [Enterococcus faecalis]
MKNKKRINLGVLIATILVVAIIGTIGVKKMTEPTEKEKQIAFLKEHEEEMTEYVKSQNSKIYSVQYDWESVEVGTIGNGTPIGAGKILTIDGKFNSIYDSSFYLQFKFDKSTKLPSIKSMTSYNSFRIGGMLYE